MSTQHYTKFAKIYHLGRKSCFEKRFFLKVCNGLRGNIKKIRLLTKDDKFKRLKMIG